MQETQVWSLSCDNPLEKGMATHSSILAWRIPWIEEAGGLQSMGSQKVTHNWATNTLGQLTELKTVFYILLSGYYKGYNSETAQWRRCRGQGRGVELPSLPEHPTPSTLMCLFANPEALWIPLLRGFHGVSLYKAWLINNWPWVIECNLYLASNLFLEDRGWDQKFEPYNYALVFWWSSPHCEAV